MYHLRTEIPTLSSVIHKLGFLYIPYLWVDGHIVTWGNCIDRFLLHPFRFIFHKLSYHSVLYILSCRQHYECAIIQVLQLTFLFIQASFCAWCSCPNCLLQCVMAVAHIWRKLEPVQGRMHWNTYKSWPSSETASRAGSGSMAAFT